MLPVLAMSIASGALALLLGPQLGLAVALAAVGLAAGVILHRSHPFTFYSPVWIVAVGLAGTGVIGFALAPSLATSGGVSAFFDLSVGELYQALYAFLGSTIAVMVGAILFFTVFGRRPWAAGDHRPAEVVLNPLNVAALLQIGPIMVVLSAGWIGIVSRGERLLIPESQAALIVLTLGQLGTLAAIGMLSWLLASRRDGSTMVLAVLLLIDLAVLFGTGSRVIALAPIVGLMGFALARSSSKPPVVLAGLAVVASLGLIFTVLAVRGLPSHGIVPYARSLMSMDGTTSSADLISALNNIVVSLPLTGHVLANGAAVTWETTLVSLNPLFGRAAGAYEVLPALRVNDATPFNALGEIWRLGAVFGALYSLSAGAILGLAASQVQRVRRQGPLGAVAALTLIGVTVLFTVSALQYNLRGTTRYLYLLLLMSVAVATLAQRRPGRARIGSRSSLLRPGLDPGTMN